MCWINRFSCNRLEVTGGRTAQSRKIVEELTSYVLQSAAGFVDTRHVKRLTERFLPAGCVWDVHSHPAVCCSLRIQSRRFKCQNDLRRHDLAPCPLRPALVRHGLGFPLSARLQGAQAAVESLRGGTGPEQHQQRIWSKDPTSHPLVRPWGDPSAAQQAEGWRLPHCLKHGAHGERCPITPVT